MKKLLFILLSLGSVTFAATAEPKTVLPKKNLTFLNKYCMDCHDADTEKGKVNLESLPFQITTIEQAERWQKVLNALNSGEMPPEKKKQPTNNEKANFLDDLSKTMVTTRKVMADSGGKITMRRLNRRDYQSSIEQLLGVKVDLNLLPEDGGGSFDTVGASQFISSDQFEQYLKLGRQAIDEAFERRATRNIKPMVFRIEPEKTVNPQKIKMLKMLDATHQKYSQWKALVDKVAKAPQNKKIVAQIHQKPVVKKTPSKFYWYANLLKNSPSPKKFGFRDSAKAGFVYQNYKTQYKFLKYYVDLPHNDRGTYLQTTYGIGRIVVKPPAKKMPPGTYTMRLRAGLVKGAPAFRQFVEFGHPQRQIKRELGLDGFPLSSHQITGTIKQPQIIETQFVVGADTPRDFAVQERQTTDAKALRSFFNKDRKKNGYGHTPAIWVDWIELKGPLPQTGVPAKLQPILDKYLKQRKLSESVKARAIITDFATTAMRQAKPESKFIEQLVKIYQKRRSSGDAFEVAIRTPLSVILASPRFLYLNEPGKEKVRRALTDRELAVRLALFLWSSPPDSQLLELAAKKKLRQPQVLRQQLERMIADSRSDKLVSGFVHQWLDMKRLDFFQFDALKHREFDENMRAAARQEVYQSFAYLLRSKSQGQLGNLLKSDYVMINGLLATHYGIGGVKGDKFRKVKLPKNSPRGGLLGMAAIHAMGSDGVHSSPIERGVWVLRHLLHEPPPPAPANVPQISRLAGKLLTTRERLLAHQEKAQCATCHRKIDPIGFGLENFDAAGKWRKTDSYAISTVGKKAKKNKKAGKKTWKIDASGTFYKGPAFADFFEMRQLIAKRQDDFARGFTEALIAYSLGRPFGFTDEDLANKILRFTKRKNYALREFFHALVQTKEFQTK